MMCSPIIQNDTTALQKVKIPAGGENGEVRVEPERRGGINYGRESLKVCEGASFPLLCAVALSSVRAVYHSSSNRHHILTGL